MTGARTVGWIAGLLVCTLQGCASRSVSHISHDVPFAGDAWPDPRTPLAVPLGALALVSNNGSDTISALDLADNRVVAALPVVHDPLAHNGPHHLVVDPATGDVFTPLAFPPSLEALGPHASHGASVTPGVLVKLRGRDLAPIGEATLDANPGDIALTPRGDRLLVTHFDVRRALDAVAARKGVEEARSDLVVIDPKTLRRVAAPRVCAAAHGVTIAADGSRAFVACYGEDAIGVVALNDARYHTELWPLGGALGTPSRVAFGPYAVTLARDGTTLAVSETEAKEVRFIDTSNGRTNVVVPTRGAAFAAVEGADRGEWLVVTQAPDQLLAVDSREGRVSRARVLTRDECLRPHVVLRGKDRWFVVCEGDHVAPSVVLEVSPKALTTLRTFEVGAYPDMLAFATP